MTDCDAPGRYNQAAKMQPGPGSADDRKPVVLDLFCGAGGMSLGFEMAGYHKSNLWMEIGESLKDR